MASGDISERARVLLKTLVERHIKDGQPVKSFNTLSEASDWLDKGSSGRSKISMAINGKRKTAYGYEWREIEWREIEC